jgi:hypothetical protein
MMILASAVLAGSLRATDAQARGFRGGCHMGGYGGGHGGYGGRYGYGGGVYGYGPGCPYYAPYSSPYTCTY